MSSQQYGFTTDLPNKDGSGNYMSFDIISEPAIILDFLPGPDVKVEERNKFQSAVGESLLLPHSEKSLALINMIFHYHNVIMYQQGEKEVLHIYHSGDRLWKSGGMSELGNRMKRLKDTNSATIANGQDELNSCQDDERKKQLVLTLKLLGKNLRFFIEKDLTKAMSKLSFLFRDYTLKHQLTVKLDKNEKCIPLCDGKVLELTTEGPKLRTRKKTDFFTKTFKVKYLEVIPPEAQKAIDQYWNGISGYADEILFLKTYLCLTFTGIMFHQKMLFFIGIANSGKSELCHFPELIMGDWGAPAPLGLIFGEEKPGGANPDLVFAIGKRLLISHEAEKQTKIKNSAIKRIVGGDNSTDRTLYAGNFTFDLQVKLLGTANDVPAFDWTQPAVVRRIMMFIFFTKFVSREEYDLIKAGEEEEEKEEKETKEQKDVEGEETKTVQLKKEEKPHQPKKFKLHYAPENHNLVEEIKNKYLDAFFSDIVKQAGHRILTKGVFDDINLPRTMRDRATCKMFKGDPIMSFFHKHLTVDDSKKPTPQTRKNWVGYDELYAYFEEFWNLTNKDLKKRIPGRSTFLDRICTLLNVKRGKKHDVEGRGAVRVLPAIYHKEQEEED